MRPDVTRYIMKPSTPTNAEAEHERAVAVRRLLRQRLHVDPHVLLREVGHEGGVGRHVVGRRDRAERLAVGEREVERVAVDDDRRHGAAVEVAQQIRERHLGDGGGAARAKEDQAAGDGDEQQTWPRR